ncbi:MAG: cbb3-type cytochrome oxidase assembly protein CcoS [Campylobacter sp.]|nr:cbb3-type cytochrome oxidase assembly protein CcoS [Campylobacter sp.]
MTTGILALMMFISIFIGLCILLGLLWGIRGGHFEDYSKFLDGTQFDSEEALNDAYMLDEKRKKSLKKKKDDRYELPD